MPPERSAERGPEALGTPAGDRSRLGRRLRSRRAIVEDHSMEPEFLPGDRVWFDRSAYRDRPPIPGEIVVASDPDGSGRLLIKAVAAVGPSTVWVVRDGVVVAPGGRPGARGAPPDAIDEVEVPRGHVFLTSRKATGTRDSRTFGPLPCDRIEGRVWFRYAPPQRRGPVGPTRGSRPS